MSTIKDDNVLLHGMVKASDINLSHALLEFRCTETCLQITNTVESRTIGDGRDGNMALRNHHKRKGTKVPQLLSRFNKRLCETT